MIPLRETETGVIFRIRVVPRASRSEVAGIQGDALKLRITAPPVEGKANEACITLLAELLGVKRTQVAIISGHASRTKTVAVEGVKAKEIAARIAAL
ncbi:MAG: YggU family protein [Proteobacteria bacterium]|nr:YggU family protein [Pseudomonadota bacterium]MBU1965756.1 YggU family protein [Pseudomonadota bacterium]